MQRYKNLRVKFLHGAEPTLHVSGGESVPLRAHTDLHAVVRAHGFALATLTDAQPECVEWAFKGECYTNAVFMQQQCTKSCADVTPDRDPSCAAWARAGECVSNAAFMSETCSTACGAHLKTEL